MDDIMSQDESAIPILSNSFFQSHMPPEHPYNFGFFPAMMRLVSTHRQIGKKFAALFEEIMFAEDSALSRRERELVAAVASAAQSCHY